jgi:predicted O-linked N-acetylglucosamine transferase (SPINDLY family)
MSQGRIDTEPVTKLLAAGDARGAMEEWKRLSSAFPGAPELVNLEGFLLLQLGDAPGAVAAAERACELSPGSASLLVNLGRARALAGDFDGALASYDKAREMSPSWDEPWISAAEACVKRGWFHAALERCRAAQSALPNNPALMWTRTNTLHFMGRSEEALESAKGAMLHNPTAANWLSDYVHHTNYIHGAAPEWVFEEHKRFGKLMTRHYAQRGPVPEPAARDGRRLRLGLISPDMRGHSVSFFVEPILRHYDRAAVELFVYFTRPPGDTVTERLKGLAEHWLDMRKMPPDTAAARIREDRLDVLIELAGHTKDNNLMVLQHRGAPVQATYLGYPNTTGMSAVNFRIVDSYTDPPGAERLATEKLLRLDPCFICFQHPEGQGEPGTPPSERNGFVTFGSFNTLKKVNGPLMDLWARVLLAVPGSRLLLKTHGLGEPAMQDEIAARFAGRGVARDRLELMGTIEDMSAHRDVYRRVDIALDTFPYNGTTTTCEALWMGVPVVTLAGTMHAGRVGVSLLSNVGLPELVASDEDEYIRVAAALAKDARRLADLCSGMRARMLASPLCDGPGFCRRFEAALAAMASGAATS